MLVANSGFLPVGRLRRPRPAGLFVFAFVATALYRLLKHALPNAALAIVALVTITTGITASIGLVRELPAVTQGAQSPVASRW